MFSTLFNFFKISLLFWALWLPWCLGRKEFTCLVGDVGSIPGLGRSPGNRDGIPFQYSCLENITDRGVWWATVHRVTKSWT